MVTFYSSTQSGLLLRSLSSWIAPPCCSPFLFDVVQVYLQCSSMYAMVKAKRNLLTLFSCFLCPLPVSGRFPAGPQLLTKLVTGQMACGAVMVPTTMFMGQVVTAFAPQQGQTQTISISQQPPQQPQQQEQQQVQQQSQVTAMQPGQAPLAQQQTQFLQVTLRWK